jgi:adenine phosphoribosyltransferase
MPQPVSGSANHMDLKGYIRDVPDFPEPGIIFKDITPLLGDVSAFDFTIAQLVERYKDADFGAIVPVESRGFLFGAPLARELGKGIIPVRKPGKLPADTLSTDYELEYGTNTMEIHVDGVEKGQKVLIIDDLLATGGTLGATARLVEMAGGVVSEIGVIIELSFLEGRKNLTGYDVYSLIQY